MRGTVLSGRSLATQNFATAVDDGDLSYSPNISLIIGPQDNNDAADNEVSDHVIARRDVPGNTKDEAECAKTGVCEYGSTGL